VCVCVCAPSHCVRAHPARAEWLVGQDTLQNSLAARTSSGHNSENNPLRLPKLSSPAALRSKRFSEQGHLASVERDSGRLYATSQSVDLEPVQKSLSTLDDQGHMPNTPSRHRAQGPLKRSASRIVRVLKAPVDHVQRVLDKVGL